MIFLQFLEPSQISPEFRESTSDLFFTLESREEKRTYVLHFIVEHQSQPLAAIRFRFQKAQMGIWTLFEERQRGKKEKQSFPPVIPILIYTGKAPWKLGSLREYFGFPELLSPFTPEIEILFLGLYTEDGEKFLKLRSALARCFELLKSLDLELDAFCEVLGRVEEELLKFGEEVFRWNLRFLIAAVYHRRPIEERELLVEFVRSRIPGSGLKKEVDEMEKSYAELLFEQGMEKGRREGMEQGAIQSKQEAVLRVLEARFGRLSEDLAERVKAIQDLKVLDDLLVLAAKCASLAGFEQALP